ncbi:MAG: hypothetical protein LIO90_09340, partial [Bacteroidales bacterium]|nr:hypothetical protein [Bacteroidales bacterium]
MHLAKVSYKGKRIFICKQNAHGATKVEKTEIFCPENLAVSKIVSNFAPQNNDGVIAQLVEQRTENPCVP